MERIAQRRLSRKLLLVATLSLLVLGLPVAWFAVRLPSPLRAPVRGAGAPASSRAGSVESPIGLTGPEVVSGTADESAGDPSGDPSAAGNEGTETIGGSIVTPDGAPIAGALVGAERSPEPVPADARGRKEDEEETSEPIPARRAASGRTNERGRFDIAGLAAGYYDLEITARGFGRRNVARAPTHGATDPGPALRIVLEPELHLGGEVVDRSAKPIAGAEVALVFLAADASDLEAPVGGGGRRSPRPGATHRTRTDADGRFRLGGLDSGVYRAEARGEGYSPSVVSLVEVHGTEASRETHLVFELDEGLRLQGIVRSEGGGPLAGARVRLGVPTGGRAIEAISGPESHTVTSGPDGAFEFEGLPEESYRLEVSASAHRDRTVKSVAAGGDTVEIVLEPRAPVEGRVVDRRSGDPVPDAEVWWTTAEDLSNHESGPAERTDATGRFRIERFPEHGEALRIDAEGYCPLWADAAPPGDGSAWTLPLERGGAVSGRVRAARDQSLDGLRVSLLREFDSSIVPESLLEETGRLRLTAASSTTDARGFYRVLAPGSGSYRVAVEGPPYAEAISEVVTVPDDQAEVENADLFLALAATAQGFVFSRDLGRLSGARVTVVPEDPPEPGASFRDRTARADATGAFSVGGLPAGAYRIVAGAPGFVTARSDGFQLAAGGTQVVELELEPEMMITGRVLDGAGEPVPLTEIRAVVRGERAGEHWNEETSIASALGTFRISRLAARPYDLRFEARGFAPAVMLGVDPGRDDVEVRLERLVQVSGKVLGTYTGEPVPEFKLRFRFEEEHRLSARDKETLHGWRSFSDPGGAFEIDDLPPGRYIVEAQATGHIGVDDLEMDVPVDRGLEDAEIRLVETGLITGVVVDGDSRPVAGARVEALQRQVDPDRGTVSFRPISLPRPPSPSADDESAGGGGDFERRRRGRDGDRIPAAVRTKEDGTFVLRGLPDGVYRVSVTHDDHLARELGDYAFEGGLSGHEPVTVSVLLPAGVTLLGRVRGAAGIETAGASVSLRPVAPDPDSRTRRFSRSKSARVDDSGHFEIRGLEIGDYVLQARFRRTSDGSYISIRRDVNIHGAGREQGILLDLSR